MGKRGAWTKPRTKEGSLRSFPFSIFFFTVKRKVDVCFSTGHRHVARLGKNKCRFDLWFFFFLSRKKHLGNRDFFHREKKDLNIFWMKGPPSKKQRHWRKGENPSKISGADFPHINHRKRRREEYRIWGKEKEGRKIALPPSFFFEGQALSDFFRYSTQSKEGKRLLFEFSHKTLLKKK